MLTLFLKFLIAHILGDFVFQPKSWVTDKEQHKLKSVGLYTHCCVHMICLAITLGFDTTYSYGFFIIVSTHFLIDTIKVYIQHNRAKRLLFFLDQLLHVLIIGIVSYVYHPSSITFEQIFTANFLLFIACILFVTHVSSIIMCVLLSYWNIDEITQEKPSLKNAGKYIGLLERLFVFGFIILGRWEGVGLLLGAKSVFRFGDLTKTDNRKLTEYVLIGTLLSFGLAILAGIIYTKINL